VCKKVRSLLLVLLALAVAAAATIIDTLIWPRYARTYQHLEAAGPDAEDAQPGVFSSHLPLVVIDTGGVAIEQNEKHSATIAIIDHEGGYNHTTDVPTLAATALINIRGKTSAKFPKKQYRLNFTVSLNSTQRASYAVMGMPPETDWVLNGPYLDKTLVRDYLMYNLAGEIMAWAPHARFCEVFLDGNYEGLYLMTEAVTVDENRVDVSRGNNLNGAVGYLLYRDILDHTKTPIQTFGMLAAKTSYELGIEFPSPSNLTDANLTYIVNDVNDFEQKLYLLENGDKTRAYADELDLGSFVDYYILNEFAMNRDAGSFSTYAYRDPRGKLTMGPVWDFNNCLDNYVDETPYTRLYMNYTNWYSALIHDKVFVETVIQRYKQLRGSILSETRILQMIDDIAAYLGPAVVRNFARWNTILESKFLGESEDGHDRNSYTYQEAVNQLKNAIILKGRFLDDNLAMLLRNPVTSPAP
jgi:spore coat protein H